MKVKRRLFWCNPYSWLVGFLVFAISLGSYVMFSNFFHNWTHVGFEAAVEGAQFDFYPMHGYTLIQLIGPVLAGISVLPVLRLKRCMPNIYLRTEHGYRFFLKRAVAYIVYGCVLMYAAYVIFLLIGALNLPMYYTGRSVSLRRDYGVGFFQSASGSVLSVGRIYTLCPVYVGVWPVFRRALLSYG